MDSTRPAGVTKQNAVSTNKDSRWEGWDGGGRLREKLCRGREHCGWNIRKLKNTLKRNKIIKKMSSVDPGHIACVFTDWQVPTKND